MSAFEKHVIEFTGRDLEHHARGQTTGIEFGRSCWNAALDEAARDCLVFSEELRSEAEREYSRDDTIAKDCANHILALKEGK